MQYFLNKGLSLIELIVSLVITIMLMGVAFAIFISIYKLNWRINELTSLNNKAIAIHQYLKSYLDIAGYSEHASLPAGAVEKCTRENCGINTPEGVVVKFVANQFNSYLSAQGQVLDCIGAGHRAGDKLTAAFYVSNSKLYCYNGSTKSVIFDGVQSMQVLAGLKQPLVRFQNLAAVTNTDDITALRLCVLLQSNWPLKGTEINPSYLDCLGNSVSNESGYLRRAYSFTYYLRNRST